MTMLFMDGFDVADAFYKWPPAAIPTSASTRFSYGQCAVVNGGEIGKLLPATTQIYIGCAMSVSNGFTQGGLALYGDAGGNAHISVMMTSTSLDLHSGRGGAILATYAATFALSTWYYIEVMATVAAAGGLCQVRLNGTQVINFTGNTKTAGTNNTTDVITIGEWQPTLTSHNFDDLYVNDSLGTINNNFLGDVRIQSLMPTAVGTSTQFTPTGSVNNWQNVSEIPDNVATYNAASTVGQRDSYALGDLLNSTGTILAIQDNHHLYKTDAGQGSIKPLVIAGGNLFYDTTQSLGDSPTWYGTIRENDPNTNAIWDPVTVDAMEIGGEVA